MESVQNSLPVIDFTNGNMNPGSTYWESVSEQVQEALENYGCFIVKYANDYSLDLHNAVISIVGDLFNLPLETKLQNRCDKNGFGYFPDIPFNPIFQGFGLGDIITSPERVQEIATKLWPNGGNDKFCELAVSQAKLQAMLYKMVIKMVLERYGIEKQYYQAHVDSIDPRLGIIKYRLPKDNESNEGLRSHMDKSYGALLDQNYVKGLEIQKKDGQWIEFEPTPSHYVFVAGEVLKAWSNGRIHSPYHRVFIRGNEMKYTIGLAAYAHGIVETPPEFVDEEHPLQYKPFSNSAFQRACIEHLSDKAPYNLIDYCGI